MLKPLKIVLITNNYTPYSSGIVSSIDATTTELMRNGHQPFIITLDFLGDSHDDPPHVKRIHCPIKFRYKKNPMAVPFRAKQQLLQLMRKLKPDIVHLHHPFLLGATGLACARQLGIPVVFTYHTMYEKYAHYVPFLKELAAPFIEKKVLQFCSAVDGIIVPSTGMQEWLQEKKIQVPMEVIPSGLRSQFLSCLRDFSHEAHDPFRLLYVGRFTQEKNIPALFKVFAQLARGNFSLTLAGFGSEYKAYEQYAFEKLKLDSRFVTFISHPENVVEQYANADLFLFPSLTDTQGIVLAESLSQGTPIVALDGHGQRDAIIEGVNGYIVQSEHAMINLIKCIAADSELHKSLSRGAQESANRYAPEVVTDQLVNFYRTIMSSWCI